MERRRPSPSLDLVTKPTREAGRRGTGEISTTPATSPEELRRLSNAGKRARASRCENSFGAVMVSRSTGRAFEIGCGRWLCAHCSYTSRLAAELVVETGIHDQWARGYVVRFLTLTDPSPGSGSMTVSDFADAWKRFVVYARRDHGEAIEAYALALEVQERGALHAHLLYTSGGGWLDARPEKNALGEVVEDSPLYTLCKRAGFGIADVRMVRRGASKLASYSAKELGGYLTKDKLEAIEAKLGKNRRPLRLSQRVPWSHRLPTLEAARAEVVRRYREELEADGEEWVEDPGEWVFGIPTPEGFRFPSLEEAEESERRERAAAMGRRLASARRSDGERVTEGERAGASEASEHERTSEKERRRRAA